jgi:hypothetical protein
MSSENKSKKPFPYNSLSIIAYIFPFVFCVIGACFYSSRVPPETMFIYAFLLTLPVIIISWGLGIFFAVKGNKKAQGEKKTVNNLRNHFVI